MAPDSIIPDGEYQLDLSGLFCPSSSESNVFGLRYGFRPENIDDSVPSLLVKDPAEDLYILQSEAKEGREGSGSSGSGAASDRRQDSHILFEGKLPAPSRGRSKSSFADYVLLYDAVGKRFRMQKFGGVIKLKKSREPDKLKRKIQYIEEHSTSEHTPGLSVVDSLLQGAQAATTNSYASAISKLSSKKRRGSSRERQRAISPEKVERSPEMKPVEKKAADKSEPGTKSPTKAVKPKRVTRPTKVKPKRSKLLRAAKNSLARSSKTKMASLVPVKLDKGPATLPRPIKKPARKTVKKLTKPQVTISVADSDSDSVIDIPSSSQPTEHILSDQDLDDFADELEEELADDEKSKSDTSDSMKIPELALADSEEDSPADTEEGFHVTVDEGAAGSINKAQEKTESRWTSPPATDSKPISMRELAASGGSVLSSRASTPSSITVPTLQEVADDGYSDEDEFDEEELDRALDDLDEEISEAE